jgi:hypothetical protein
VIEYVWLLPQVTTVAPAGVTEPFGPDEAVIVYGPFCTNVALIVWFACTFVNVNELIAPCDTPSTSTFWIEKQLFGVIVNVWMYAL